jgi:hypothetical protein
VNVSAPVAAPEAVGVNVTPTVHVAPAATLVPQVLLEMPKGPLVTMPESVSNPLWLLVKVTDLGELVEPTAVVPKLRDEVDSVTGAAPVPLRVTICGLVTALSVKVSVPVAAPSPVGVKATPTLQLPLAAMPAPQVLLAMANGPLATMLLKLSAVLIRLVTVTERAAPVLPTARFPKLKLLGEKVTGATPLPLSAAICFPALSVIVTLPVALPAVVGENVTEIEQEEPEAIGAAVQLSVLLNGAEATIVETFSGPVPVLRNVIVRAALVAPITVKENESDVGVKVAAGVVPVPLSTTVCAVPAFPDSSLILRVPVTVPDADGVKVTDTVQDAPACRVEGQSSVCAKPPAAETVSPVNGLPPKLLMMTVCGALAAPTFWENVSVLGVNLIAEGRELGSGTGTAP